MNAPRILVVIHYPVDVGFAVGRLVSVFYRMAVRIATSPADVHFSFTDLGSGRCASLPEDFSNYFRFEPRSNDAAMHAALAAYLKAHGIDLIFGFDVPVEAGFLAPARDAGVRAVVSYFGAPLSSILPWPVLLMKRAEVRWLRPSKPDLFIVESNAMLRTAVAGRGLPPSVVKVIPNGVSISRFAARPEDAGFVYARFAIPPHRKVVVYMGHFHQRKGVHILLQAARLIVRDLKREDVHFLFLGTTERDVEKMRSIVDYSMFASNITLGGYQEQVPRILAGCAVGCVPTTGWDSFPLSPLEMQACSLPVVVSDCQGLPETVEDQETGIVVRAGDHERLAGALLTLVDDDARRRRMGLAARSRIEMQYTDEIQVERLAGTTLEAWTLRAHFGP